MISICTSPLPSRDVIKLLPLLSFPPEARFRKDDDLPFCNTPGPAVAGLLALSPIDDDDDDDDGRAAGRSGSYHCS